MELFCWSYIILFIIFYTVLNNLEFVLSSPSGLASRHAGLVGITWYLYTEQRILLDVTYPSTHYGDWCAPLPFNGATEGPTAGTGNSARHTSNIINGFYWLKQLKYTDPIGFGGYMDSEDAVSARLSGEGRSARRTRRGGGGRWAGSRRSCARPSSSSPRARPP